MSEFKAALKPYSLEAALAADRGDDCIVVDIGCGENEHFMPSFERVVEHVDQYIKHPHSSTFAATKLYVIGDWNLTPHEAGEGIDPEAKGIEIRVDEVAQWIQVTEKIETLLQQMSNLEELTWISGLPFTARVWEKVPTSLTKLVLDLGEPVRLDQDGHVLHKSYITPSEMKPLEEYVNLRELRLFRVRESLQPLVWKTVFRNTSRSGMRVLDLQMAAAPIVRSQEWRKAKDVAGLTVSTEQSLDKQYKGSDGKGILHFAIGTGEYLDDFCMRKARIASSFDQAAPLPLWCLKIDGFVIDHLPFENELSRIVLLTCGDNCIDSGMRAPKTLNAYNKWSRAVNNATSHCLIQWPNWTGIFDGHGDQRNTLGVVIPQEMAISTPLDELSPSPTLPLTEDSLKMKELDDALVRSQDLDYFKSAPGSSAVQNPLDNVSNVSERNSDVLTLTVASSTCSPAIPTLTASTSFAESDVVVVNGAGSSLSSTSTLGSFDNVSPPAPKMGSNVASAASSKAAINENSTPNESTFTHKVRRSLGWFSGS